MAENRTGQTKSYYMAPEDIDTVIGLMIAQDRRSESDALHVIIKGWRELQPTDPTAPAIVSVRRGTRTSERKEA